MGQDSSKPVDFYNGLTMRKQQIIGFTQEAYEVGYNMAQAYRNQPPPKVGTPEYINRLHRDLQPLYDSIDDAEDAECARKQQVQQILQEHQELLAKQADASNNADADDEDEAVDQDDDPEISALVREYEDSTDEDASYKNREDLSNKEMDEAEIRSGQRERD